MPLASLKPQLSPLMHLWRILQGMIIAGILFSLLLLCNVMQCLSAIFLPISRRFVRYLNRYIGGFWWATCDLFAVYVHRIEIIISGDPLPLGENVMVTVNHQDMPDICTLFRLARSQGRIGDLKWFVKDILKYVPGLGWGMVFLDCIFLKRDWKQDKTRLFKQLSRFEEDQIPIWTLSFVEGTRMKTHKLKAALAFAQERGIEPHAHLLLPRTKGFCLTLDALRTHLDAVYDATIGYVDGVPSLWQWCRGDVQRVYLHVRRYPVTDLPQEEEELAEWLKDRWYEKDALLDHFYREGDWPQSETPS